MRATENSEAQDKRFWLVLARGMQKPLKKTLFQAPRAVTECRSQRENAKSTTIFDVASAAAEACAATRHREAETLKLCAL